ncbi:hypothetical protein QBC41DRAFT_299782 [Cercophora samala]|uniref:Uncharacterized protein n=1 Tax=Cercophora samala TaxID=330535 RepID=A0AA39ZJQ5_9PEZI|nr:hypothetical protein QBC41DRAFT_299782 [Cercophora samala]
MKTSVFSIAASVLALFGTAQAFQVPDDVPDVTWDMPIDLTNSSSPTVRITGTIQQAIAQMEKAYPGWKNNIKIQATPAADKPAKIDCWPKGEERCVTINIVDGITYLSNQFGLAQNDPGKCGRVSCSYNSAILWCNNDKKLKKLPWQAIADAALDIVQECTGVERRDYTKGHAEFAEKWTAIVRKEYC